jgi:hypothetical protein
MLLVTLGVMLVPAFYLAVEHLAECQIRAERP